MLAYQYEGLEVDSCPECFGIWFDCEELKEFIQRPELAQKLAQGHAHNRASQESQRLCPVCKILQTSTWLGEVKIDLCLRCRGIWLDQGELAQAMEQYKKGQRGNLLVLNQIAEGLRTARQKGESQ